MSDYISRQDAVRKCGEWYVEEGPEEGFIGTVSQMLDMFAPADVVPVRHGTWLPIVSYNNTYKCSECGRLLVDITDGLKMVAKHYPYCHCGAKMDAKGEE